MTRRMFLALGAGAVCSMSLHSTAQGTALTHAAPDPFKISLAEWSLNRALRAKKLTNLDFPKAARQEYKIDCIEFVDQFFADKAKDMGYLKDLKSRAEGEGVTMGLIMLDTNGPLGTPHQKARDKAVEKTFEWIDAAAFLGCKTIRVNARGSEDPDELRQWIVDSGVRLADYAAERSINVTIENHGGPSSDPAWLVSVMQQVNKPNFGTLPDFGNFPDGVNRYDAVEAFMPFAKAVSAKASGFTPEGLVAETDYVRMMRIVRDGGYTGYVGVETSPERAEDEPQAIHITRDLLLRIREEERRCLLIFNDVNLDGWEIMAGGDWTVENGVLIGRNGRDWSTDPEKTGSWLRTGKEYGDFRLELQYTISENGNSGVFFRSALDKNPAFTGYEMQIYDAPGQPPSKQGPSAIYDTVAPSKNLVHPAGQWNTVTITARGQKISIEMNGEVVIDTELDRSAQGYIGLQNHDERAVVKFRNLRLEEL